MRFSILISLPVVFCTSLNTDILENSVLSRRGLDGPHQLQIRDLQWQEYGSDSTGILLPRMMASKPKPEKSKNTASGSTPQAAAGQAFAFNSGQASSSQAGQSTPRFQSPAPSRPQQASGVTGGSPPGPVAQRPASPGPRQAPVSSPGTSGSLPKSRLASSSTAAANTRTREKAPASRLFPPKTEIPHQPLSSPWMEPQHVYRNDGDRPNRIQRAEQLQKNLGVDKLKPPITFETHKENMASFEAWHKDLKESVGEAKRLQRPWQQSLQPMSVDKAKVQAKKSRELADKHYQTMAMSPTTPEQRLGMDSRFGKAQRAFSKDWFDAQDLAQKHGQAAVKAENDKRWGDVAKHQQAAARTWTRAQLRRTKMDTLTKTHYSMGEPNSERQQQATEEAAQRHGEHKVMKDAYRKIRESTSGSDTDEEAPKPWKVIDEKDQTRGT